MPKGKLTRSRFIKDATLREAGPYLTWLMRNRDTGLLTEIGRVHLRWVDSVIAHMRENHGWPPDADPAFTNLLAGLSSPDEEQKRRFEAFADVVADYTFDHARPLLAVLEHGKRTAGRRTGNDDSEALRKMKLAVSRGMSIPQAASAGCRWSATSRSGARRNAQH